jgi:hypothetical protein
MAAFRFLRVGLVLGVAACASTPPRPTATYGAPSSADARPRPYPVFESHAFADAVAKGTRTRTGEPGPKYWQQYATYRIDARLDPATATVSGRETVRYFNRSPDTLRVPRFYLNQNLFKPGATRTDETPVTMGMQIQRIAAAGQPLAQRDTGTGYTIEGTVMFVTLPARLLPGDSVDIDIEWSFQVPPDGAPREGKSGDVWMIAYWYPQLAVFDDIDGWVTDPYLGNAEFYMGYADYDVSLTVPQGWLIASTGELTNASDILSAQTNARLRDARRGASIVHVVSDNDRGVGAGKATNATPNGQLTWKFRGRNIRDFDWAASPSYLWDATIAVVGDRDGDGRADTTSIHTF